MNGLRNYSDNSELTTSNSKLEILKLDNSYYMDQGTFLQKKILKIVQGYTIRSIIFVLLYKE